MNYFEARRAESLFEEFKRLTLDFWDAEDKGTAKRASQRREELTGLHYTANTFATLLNVGVTAEQYPAPLFGGPVLPVNFLRAAIEPDQGYTAVPRSRVLDAINGCIGAARYHRRRARSRLLNPLCWLVDVPTALVRWPFLIMRRAGVTPNIEENIVSQVIKVVMVVAIFGVAAWFGVKITFEDILKLWK